ncbi:MAG TPA: hypothetical protein VD816_16965, partial [Ohtaekwangia sp.]|nr:hypothetical protein [Ohtaekwangia sp.]
MLRLLLCIALLTSSAVMFGQPRIGNLYTTAPFPYYVLSSDGKTLGVYQGGEDLKPWLAFIDLNTFTWLPEATILLDKIFLSPDFKIAYTAEINIDGFKGNADWLPYKKYLSWYYPNSTSLQKVQWPDRNLIMAIRSDGKFITAGTLKFKKEKHLMHPTTTVVDLNLTDPVTGNVISNIRKGEVMRISYDRFGRTNWQLADNDNLLVVGDGSRWTSFNLTTGVFTNTHSNDQLTARSGKYVMGATFKDATIGAFKYRKLVMNLETGQAVHDEMISTTDVLGYWCAAGMSNSFYTLTAKTGELAKEEIIDNKLVVTKTVKLDITDVEATGKWPYLDHGFHSLVVSEPLGMALLLPVSYKDYHRFSKMVLGWRLEDGKLTYVNYDFVRPKESYLQREAAENAAWVKRMTPATPSQLPLNTLLRSREGFHVLLGKDQQTSKWKAIKFNPTGDGNFSPSEISLAETDFPRLFCEVVSSTPCGQCHGHGAV